MMRAQFWNRIHNDHSTNSWHLNLAPSVKRARRMQVPFGFWFFGTDASGAIEFARTLFLTTFTLPTNGKEFTVPVELRESALAKLHTVGTTTTLQPRVVQHALGLGCVL